jgi:diguanylate cyclase (GGDEF)-like protein
MKHGRLEHIMHLVRDAAAQDGREPIAIDSPQVYAQMVREALDIARSDESAHGLVVIDPHTFCDPAYAGDIGALRRRVLVLGEERSLPFTGVDAAFVPFELDDDEYAFVLISDNHSVALLGRANGQRDGAGPGLDALAATLRSEVELVAERLTAGQPLRPRLPKAGPRAVSAAQRDQARLMAVLARQLIALEQHIAVDKHDLFSVLEILKAISSKRRSHDILFVFVEQIARVVRIDRCSVVRVWAGEEVGHVLASHEDATVANITIELGKYPELRRTLETRDLVVIDNIHADPLTKEVGEEAQNAPVGALVVIPIVLYDPNVGSLLLRAARKGDSFSAREVGFFEVVAEAAANALERAQLFESIQRANERLERLAITDGLTGLYNHRHFLERLTEECERARRYEHELSCIIFDIDNFKRINDTFGHLQGDSILRQMSKRISEATRKSDVVARYGGEEFAVIMPQTDRDGAAAEAERLRCVLGDSPYLGMPPGQRVTVSIGVGALWPEMESCEALIRTADAALYEAKRTGKNRVVVHKE